MKLMLVGLTLVSVAAQANCNLYVSDTLALSDKSKKNEQIIDQDFFGMLQNKGYNPYLKSKARWPIRDGYVLSYNTAIVENPAFLKKGIASLHFKLVDQNSNVTTYSHLHGVSCKFRMKKDRPSFEKDCMSDLKTEIEFLPNCDD